MTARAELSTDQVNRLKDLFEEALDTPFEARSAFLVEACSGDPVLEAELGSLLEAHDRSSGFFEKLADEVIAAAVSTIERNDRDEWPAAGRAILHYELLDRIGGGGMGVVYKARDTRLNRVVALKFLPQRHASNPAARARLLAEARAASALDNQNIGVVYEIAEAEDGRPFIAMAWYDGETLKARARRERMAPSEVIAIGRQLCNALSAAHAAGIVHRDVKPANVIVTGSGVAKLVDFGIAKLLSEDGGDTHDAAGTVGYMSPEQTRGTAIDARTDIWSLGVLLYEILYGQRPFRGRTDQQVIESIRQAAPAALSETRDDVTEQLHSIVTRCLQKNPGDRYQSATELSLALADTASAGSPPRQASGSSKVVIASLAAAVMLAAGIWGYTRSGTFQPFPATVATAPSFSIAVLPFVAPAAADSTRYLVTSLEDEIRTEIARVPELAVPSRESVHEYSATSRTFAEVAHELDADYLVQGTLASKPGSNQLLIRLIDGKSGTPVWSRRWDVTPEATPGIPRGTAKEVFAKLPVALPESEMGRLGRHPTASALAYDLYLRGRFEELSAAPQQLVGPPSREGMVRAQAFYAQVRALDPQFALARARLAATHIFSASMYDTTRARREQARVEAEAALRADSLATPAYEALSSYLARNGQGDSALAVLRHGVRRAPNNVGILFSLGQRTIDMGRWEEGIAEYEKVIRLDPRNSRAYWRLATTFGRMRRQDRGMIAFNKLLELKPDDHELRLIRGQSYLRWKGTPDTLLAALNKIPEGWDRRGMATFSRYTALMVQRRYGDVLTMLGDSRSGVSRDGLVYHPTPLMRAEAYRGLGDSVLARRNFEIARSELADSIAANPGNSSMRSALALVYAGLGRKEAAIREAEKAMDLSGFATNTMNATAFMGLAVETYARVGEIDRAFQMIELMLTMPSGREITVPYLEVWPGFDPLRTDRRFEELVKRFPLRFDG